MTDLKNDEGSARPNSGRAFLERTWKVICRPFFPSGIVLPGLKAQLVFWPLMAVGLTLDLWSKRAVFAWLKQRPSRSISVIDGFLQLVVAENPGAAFGIATGQRYLLAAVSVIALIVMLVIFLFGNIRQTLMQISLALFAAGIIGNLYDRIFNDGLVRDFIDVVYWPGKHWPAFNVADSMLCIGVGLMIFSSIFTGRHSRKRAQQRK